MMRKLLTGGEVETGTVADLEGLSRLRPPPFGRRTTLSLYSWYVTTVIYC